MELIEISIVETEYVQDGCSYGGDCGWNEE